MNRKEYGDTKLERWAFRHKDAIQWFMAALTGFAIGMFVAAVVP